MAGRQGLGSYREGLGGRTGLLLLSRDPTALGGQILGRPMPTWRRVSLCAFFSSVVITLQDRAGLSPSVQLLDTSSELVKHICA